MSTKEEYIADIRNKVREANAAIEVGMSEESYTRFLRTALRRFSIDKPREIVSEFAGTGQKYYTIDNTNFPSFVEGSSSIKRIEAIGAIVADKENPRYIERDSWDYFRDSIGLRLYFKEHQPDSSDTVRVLYTIPHTIDDLDSAANDTVPSIYYDAVVYWGASEALQAIANKYAGTSDPTIRADVVNYRSKSREFSMRADDYRSLYFKWIMNPERYASTTRSIDMGYSFGDNQPFLTHRSFSRN